VKRSQVAVAFACAAMMACKTSFDFVPVTPAEARRATTMFATQTHGEIVDELGRHHEVADASTLYVRERGDAAPATILGFSPTAIDPTHKYDLAFLKSVPDGDAILGWSVILGLTGGLIAGNVACFATDVCADGTSIAVGIADGVVIVAGVVLLVALAAAFSHFRGD